MVRYDGIIHLENEDIAVESLNFLGHIKPTGSGDLIVDSRMELRLDDNAEHFKLLDLNLFSIEFRDTTINFCTLKKNIDQTKSINTLGFLQGDIESKEDCLKMLD